MFKPNYIALAIITYYPKWYKGKLESIANTDKIRGDLALKFIKTARAYGYQLVVVDGKSAKDFQRELSNFKDINIVKRESLKSSPARRQGFKVASKLPQVRVIVATEPEKVSLIDSAKYIALPILNNEVDIVIPKRENNLFKKTYPDYMYKSESKANKIYNEQLKNHNILKKKDQSIDIFFGPKAFRNDQKTLNLFLKQPLKSIKIPIKKEYFDPEMYSNTLYFPVVLALKKKFKIKNVQIPFKYPDKQNGNETIGERSFFIEKRHNQSRWMLNELRTLFSYFAKRQN